MHAKERSMLFYSKRANSFHPWHCSASCGWVLNWPHPAPFKGGIPRSTFLDALTLKQLLRQQSTFGSPVLVTYYWRTLPKRSHIGRLFVT
ncbi:hypothetical protein CDAR_19571 [Caerostris darwini]|uniref:Uncharacterized protein n=1 Tax=Caerostris darwini TaxID=1538125 RepID=A0AAV4WBG4_9ARAC|nr:hypothetical protein CDAR_19571 [Caerostris darwini]